MTYLVDASVLSEATRPAPHPGVVAWLNIELTKNSAEIGYARFLKASR